MVTLTVAGRVDSPSFQKSRALASLGGPGVTIKSLLPVDYDSLLAELCEEIGGALYQHTAPVVAYTATEYIGDEAALLLWLRRKGVDYSIALNSDGFNQDWESMAAEAYTEKFKSRSFSLFA